MTRHRVIATTAAALAVGLLAATAPAVVAEPQKTIAEVQAEIDALQNEAEMVAEDLNGARARLDRIHGQQATTQKKVDKARSSLAAQSRNIGTMASIAYRSGGLDQSVQLLMADNPADFLQQSAALEVVAKGQNATLRRTSAARMELAQATVALDQQEQDAAALEKEIADKKAAIDANLAQQQQVLSQLKEEERRRLEAERKARAEAARRAAAAAQAAAEEAARQAQIRAASAANNEDTTGSSSSGGSSSGGSTETSANGGPANVASNDSSGSSGQNSGFVGSDQAAIAVAAALAQVGEPYTYDAHPPDTWDCSKLTAWAWGQAGVSLTAYSYDQGNEVRHLPDVRPWSTAGLRPGDLLFYFNGAHHVAMYIGGGQMVEAANPDAGVRVTDVWNNWAASAFSYAGRPVG